MTEAGLILCIVVLWIMIAQLADRITKLERASEECNSLTQEPQ